MWSGVDDMCRLLPIVAGAVLLVRESPISRHLNFHPMTTQRWGNFFLEGTRSLERSHACHGSLPSKLRSNIHFTLYETIHRNSCLYPNHYTRYNHHGTASFSFSLARTQRMRGARRRGKLIDHDVCQIHLRSMD
jgi:hypothetical protein